MEKKSTLKVIQYVCTNCIIIFLLLNTNKSWGQGNFTASWPFTSTLSSSVTGTGSSSVTAATATKSAAFTTSFSVSGGNYSGTGITGNASSSCSTSYNAVGSSSPITPYMEFDLSPNSGYSMTTNSFTFSVTSSNAVTYSSIAAGYSTDGGVTFTGLAAPTGGGSGANLNASPKGSTWSSSQLSSSTTLTFTVPSTTVSATNGFVLRIVIWRNNASGSSQSAFLISGPSISGTTTVSATPTITTPNPNSLSGFNYNPGTGPSTSQSLTVGGSNLSANIVITPPTDYEISSDNSSFSSSAINLSPSSGTVSSTRIYVRLKSGLSSGNYNNETIVITSTGATTQNVSCSGGVTASYYYAGTGSLATVNSWGSNSDGTGSHPSDFVSNYQLFYLKNTSSVSTDAAWTVSGTNSKIILGSSSAAALTLTVTSGNTISSSSIIDITAANSGNNTLVVQGTTLPTFGTLDATSKVDIQAANTISSATSFGYLSFTGATVTLSNSITITNDFTISGAGVLSFSNGSSSKSISIGGNCNITGTGGITQTSGSGSSCSITLTGTNKIFTNTASNNSFAKSNINITGSYSLGGNFDYASASASRTISITGSLTLAGYTLNIESGNLSISNTGQFIVSPGQFIVSPGGAILGNYAGVTGAVTIQQSMIAQRGYRVFANPFSTSQTNLSSTGLNATVTTANDVKTWDQTAAAWSSAGSGYGSVTIAGNQPYACFIRGASTDNVSGSSYTTGPSAFTYSVSGTLNGASTGITPANTSNYLIVGNPYAAPVNTQALTGQSSTGYYTYQINVSGNGQTKQGSWVASGGNSNTSNTIPVLGVVAYLPASTSTFNITTSDINTGGTAQGSLFGVEKPFTQMELLLQHANGDYADKLFVRLDASATNNGTDKMELKKLYNDVTNVYTIADDKNSMAIDARSALNTIPMGISTTAGDYTFKLNSNSLPDGTTIYINDKYTNTKTELTAISPYNFSVTSDAASQGTGRFELVFSNKSITTLTDPSPGTLKAAVIGNIIHGNTVALQIEGAVAPVNVLVKDISGKAISTAKANNGIQYISIGNTGSGMILLQISDGKSTVIQKVMKL